MTATLTHENGRGFVLLVDDEPVPIAEIMRLPEGGMTVKTADGTWHSFGVSDGAWIEIPPKPAREPS